MSRFRYSPILEGSLKELIHSVKTQRLEGLIAKRCEYELGRRSLAFYERPGLRWRLFFLPEKALPGHFPGTSRLTTIAADRIIAAP
jgi:hypothetical protein